MLVSEDAKRLAIKEEQYDPGYEDAFGGAYTEAGGMPGGGAEHSNGHCSFSAAGDTGENTHTCARALSLTYTFS